MLAQASTAAAASSFSSRPRGAPTRTVSLAGGRQAFPSTHRAQHRQIGGVRRASPFVKSLGSRETPTRGVDALQAKGGQVQVVTIGEALFDLLASDDQKGKLRADVESWDPYPGGAPTNVATALAQLGIKTALFTALGKDDLGEELLALITKRGVDVSGCLRTDKSTRGVFVERKLDGDRVFAGFAEAIDSYADCFIDPEKLPLDLVKTAFAVVSGTLGLAYPVTRKGMEAVVDAAKSSGSMVVIDANWRPMFWTDPDSAKPIVEEFLAKADILKITDEEAEWLYGISAKDALDNPGQILERLPNATAVLVTAGEKGAAYCIKTAGKSMSQGFVPVLDVDVADTTGAGDAFTAGFLAFALKAGGLEALVSDPGLMMTAAKYGAATGGLTCTGKGAISPQPSLEAVEEVVSKMP